MRKKLFLIGLISISAFLIRVQICRELLHADPQVTNPSNVTDMRTYINLSTKIAKGDFNEIFYYQPFFYAVYLPLIRIVLGNGIWPFLIIQSLISALTVFLTGLNGLMLRNLKTGIIAALLMTFSAAAMFYVPYFIIATLQGFWVSLILFLSICYIRNILFFTKKELRIPQFLKSTTFQSSLLGLVTATAILTRGNVWFFVPGLIALILLSPSPDSSKRKKAINLTLFITFILLPQVPFALHNTRMLGHLSGPSTAAGNVLALGNTPEAPPGMLEYPETYKSWTHNQNKIPVYWKMLEWFSKEPLAFMELQFRKLLLFWDCQEIPNNVSIEYQGRKSNTLKTLGLLRSPTPQNMHEDNPIIRSNIIPSSAILLITGLSGLLFFLFRLLSNARTAFKNHLLTHLPDYTLLYLAVAYWLATAVFYILTRFSMPILPLLAVAGGIFINTLLTAIKKRRKCRTLTMQLILILLISSFTVLAGYPIYRFKFELPVMRLIRPHGVRVKLNDNTVMICDNGPRSFGSWTPMKLDEGSPLIKRFDIPPGLKKTTNSLLKIQLYWMQAETATIEVNGEKMEIEAEHPGLNTATLPVKGNISEVKIRLLNADTRIYCIIDLQRNYGRTELNGKKSEGELVAALHITEK